MTKVAIEQARLKIPTFVSGDWRNTQKVAGDVGGAANWI
jgi:hypothetical protein